MCRFVSCREIKQNFRLFQFSPRERYLIWRAARALKVGLITLPENRLFIDFTFTRAADITKTFRWKSATLSIDSTPDTFPCGAALVFRLRRENPKLADDITGDGRKTRFEFVLSVLFSVERIVIAQVGDLECLSIWLTWRVRLKIPNFLDYFRFRPEPSAVFSQTRDAAS